MPRVRKSGEGNPSETQIGQERAAALMTAGARAPPPRELIAEAKLYPAETATPLAPLGFLTRLPGPLTRVSQVITQALRWDRWHRLAETPRDDRLELGHDGMAQRGRVVSSPAALARAEASSTTAPPRAWAAIEQPLFHWPAPRFATPEVAPAALTALAQGGRSQQRDPRRVMEPKRYAGKGRPPPHEPPHGE